MLSRPLATSGATPSTPQTVLTLFVVGWVTIAATEVIGIRGAPNVAFCLAVSAGVLHGSEIGFWSGIAVGLGADLLSGLPLGSQALAAGIVGTVVGQASLALRSDAWPAPIMLLAVGALPFRLLVKALARCGGLTITVCADFAEGVRFTLFDLGLGFLAYLVLARMASHRRT